MRGISLEIVDISKVQGQAKDIEEIVDWIRSNEKDGNVKKLSVIIEANDGKIYSRAINLKNKDYLWFLFNEILELME